MAGDEVQDLAAQRLEPSEAQWASREGNNNLKNVQWSAILIGLANQACCGLTLQPQLHRNQAFNSRDQSAQASGLVNDRADSNGVCTGIDPFTLRCSIRCGDTDGDA